MPTQDLISRAARFFILAEQASGLRFSDLFWNLSAPPVVKTVVKTADRLPAMAAAVRGTVNLFLPDVLESLASHPLPRVLPPEAVRWYNHLVATWEVHRASRDVNLRNLARLALVRLDGCGMPDGHERPSRLPEWLAEARKIASGEWRVVNREWRVVNGEKRVANSEWRMAYGGLQALAALAAWRPAPRVITPPETLWEWVNFWLKLCRSKNPVKKGVASIALLNLPEADLRAASIPPVPTAELLHQLTRAIEVAAEREDRNYLSLLDWQPVTGTTWPVAEVRKVAQSWLDVTGHKDCMKRRAAWQQLIRWDQAGSLTIGGTDLLPVLVKAVLTENDEDVLWAIAQWSPAAAQWSPAAERFTATKIPDRRFQLQQLEEAWKRHRVSVHLWNRASAWLAGIHLHQAGLASESPESFMNAYLSSLAGESYTDVLFILGQWSPGTGMPGIWHRNWKDGWQRRLGDEDRSTRPIAAWALLRHLLEQDQGRSLRGAALELWRTGTKTSSEARHIPGAAFARFQEVRAHLAAGEVPDFEEKPVPPAERCRPSLALPPGRILDSEWKMENEELKMENGKWRVVNGERRVSSEF